MPDSIKIDSIGQIAIAIYDIDKSVDFYKNILGLELLFQAPPGLAFLIVILSA
jgi:methylmalonyl-CoA/ethylmalonyl-CoA epimerase